MQMAKMTDSEGVAEPPRAVRGIASMSRSVLRRATHAHYARAICGALGTFALTVAFALMRGSRLGDAEVYLLAALLALATLASWIRSERIESRAVLQRIDERLHLAGAFLSAHESCATSPGSPLTQLGAAKLLQRVRPSQAMEAAVPHTLGFVVLPLLGLLAVVQTVQVRDARRSTAGRVTVEVGTVADHLHDIERMNREALSAMQRAELAEIQRAAEAAAKNAAEQFLDGAPKEELDPKEHWAEQMRSVADDLDELASQVPQGSDLAEQLASAAAEAEAVAMGSEPQDVDASASSPEESSSAEAESGDGRFAGSEEGAGGGDSSYDVGATTAGDLLADAAEDVVEVEPGGGDAIEPTSGMGGPGKEESAEESAGEPAGQVAAADSAALTSGEDRRRVGVLKGPPSQERPALAAGLPAEDRAAADPAPDEAEELLDRSQWWADRDDAIVRAWLAKRAPK
jgi:hypothetical protein